MEVNVLKEEKDNIELEIKGEDHTFCNILRSELWNLEDTNFAAYAIKHPLMSSPIFTLHVKKGKPRKVLNDAVDSLRSEAKGFKSALKSL